MLCFCSRARLFLFFVVCSTHHQVSRSSRSGGAAASGVTTPSSCYCCGCYWRRRRCCALFLCVFIFSGSVLLDPYAAYVLNTFCGGGRGNLCLGARSSLSLMQLPFFFPIFFPNPPSPLPFVFPFSPFGSGRRLKTNSYTRGIGDLRREKKHSTPNRQDW